MLGNRSQGQCPDMGTILKSWNDLNRARSSHPVALLPPPHEATRFHDVSTLI